MERHTVCVLCVRWVWAWTKKPSKLYASGDSNPRAKMASRSRLPSTSKLTSVFFESSPVLFGWSEQFQTHAPGGRLSRFEQHHTGRDTLPFAAIRIRQVELGFDSPEALVGRRI